MDGERREKVVRSAKKFLLSAVGRAAAGDGLVQDTVEATIMSMGYVGRVGMHSTDVEILNIMIGKTCLEEMGC